MVARELRPRTFQWRDFTTETVLATGEARDNRVVNRTGLTTRPFRSVGTRDLARQGYVVFDRLGLVFRAPDEIVLTDDTFIDSHCFWTAYEGQDSTSGLIALHFSPVSRIDRNDISGTFWLDPRSYHLTSFQFNYTRSFVSASRLPISPASVLALAAADSAVRDDSLAVKLAPAMMSPGGELRFRRLEDGTVVVDSWRMWATDNWIHTSVNGIERLPQPNVLRETGGAILNIRRQN
jgi:hypothetical protein